MTTGWMTQTVYTFIHCIDATEESTSVSANASFTVNYFDCTSFRRERLTGSVTSSLEQPSLSSEFLKLYLYHQVTHYMFL